MGPLFFEKAPLPPVLPIPPPPSPHPSPLRLLAIPTLPHPQNKINPLTLMRTQKRIKVWAPYHAIRISAKRDSLTKYFFKGLLRNLCVYSESFQTCEFVNV
jgi:hypothetical protein